jgi:phosphoglycolate phosphatase
MKTDRPLQAKHVFFDLDGTLTDPKEGITKSIAYALNKLGITPPSLDDLEWCIGPPLHKSFQKMLGDEQKTKDAVAFYREYYSKTGIFENSLYQGIVEALDTLGKSGRTLYVATSKPKCFADKIIDHFKLNSHFKVVYGSELDGTRSDKAELISFILNQENIVASDCVMIGDREHDLIGARKNQVRGIGVSWGYGSKAELTEAAAEVILGHPNEIYHYFAKE